MKNHVLFSLAAFALVFAHQQTLAEAGKTSFALEEVTVTARRRSESLQDVPTMVRAVTGEELAKYGINSVEDLELTTPGLIYADAVGYAMPYIRGVGSNSFSPAIDPTVGTFVDGFYSPSTVGSLQYIGDVESVQVLKGPQGTLFGRNTTAGAIVINTKKPAEEFEGKFEYGVGTRNKEYLSVFLSGPLTDALGISISAYKDEVETHYKSTYQGPDGAFEFAPEKRDGIKAKLRIDPLDWLSFDLNYSESNAEGSKGIIAGVEDAGQINSSAAAAQTPDRPRTTAQNINGFTSVDSESLTGKLTFAFDRIEAWILGGYTDVVGGTLGDLDLTENESFAYRYNKDARGYFSDIDSIEFQIGSVSDWAVFGMSYNWMIGGYGGEATAGWDPLIFDIGAELATAVAGLPSAPISLVDGVRAEIAGVVDTEAEALFANFSVDLLDWLQLDLGVRQSKETRTIRKNKVDLYSSDPVFGDAAVPVRDISGPKLSFNDTSYLVGLNFHLNDSSMLYAKFVQGFKSGTWNVTALTDDPDAIDPEMVDSYEIGFKGEFFDRTIRLNAAVYEYDYRGLQNYQVELTGGGSVLVRSMDAARIRGAEFDLTVAPPIEGLQFVLSGSYIDSEVTEWPDAPCYDPETYLNETCDLAGNSLGGAPMFTASLDINYGFQLFGDEFQVGGNVYHNGGFFFDVQNFAEQGEYHVVGVRASWYRDEWGTTVSIAGKNITSEDYRDFGMLFEAGVISRYAPAAEWTAAVSWEFGS